jgi:hypothetical protein
VAGAIVGQRDEVARRLAGGWLLGAHGLGGGGASHQGRKEGKVNVFVSPPAATAAVPGSCSQQASLCDPKGSNPRHSEEQSSHDSKGTCRTASRGAISVSAGSCTCRPCSAVPHSALQAMNSQGPTCT